MPGPKRKRSRIVFQLSIFGCELAVSFRDGTPTPDFVRTFWRSFPYYSPSFFFVTVNRRVGRDEICPDVSLIIGKMVGKPLGWGPNQPLHPISRGYLLGPISPFKGLQ